MEETQRQGLAALGKAQREHLTNQLRILEGAQQLHGIPLVQVEIQREALTNLEGAPDWKIGLAYLAHLIETEGDELQHLAGPFAHLH